MNYHLQTIMYALGIIGSLFVVMIPLIIFAFAYSYAGLVGIIFGVINVILIGKLFNKRYPN